MTAVSNPTNSGSRAMQPAKSRTIHPISTRLFHWINAASVIVMIGSGLAIFNSHPVLEFGNSPQIPHGTGFISFPGWMTIGGGLTGALLWHFAAMWVFAGNLVLWIIHGIVTGRFRRKLWPISPRAVAADFLAALKGKLGHADLSVYNAVQRLLYAGVILVLALAVVSGLAMWKPMQFQTLSGLFGGFQGTRIVHFLAMAGISGFLLIHVVMAFAVPKSIIAMLRGR